MATFAIKTGCIERIEVLIIYCSYFVHTKSHASRVRLAHFTLTHAFPPAWNLSHASLFFRGEKSIKWAVFTNITVYTTLNSNIKLLHHNHRRSPVSYTNAHDQHLCYHYFYLCDTSTLRVAHATWPIMLLSMPQMPFNCRCLPSFENEDFLVGVFIWFDYSSQLTT